MFYHSIPTLACYAAFFILIRKGMLPLYAGAVYVVITIYMAAGNICLGYNAGFHLYCISLMRYSSETIAQTDKLYLFPGWVVNPVE